MVLHDLELLMKKIPEIENIVTFYDDGTVFQTTFDKNKVNIHSEDCKLKMTSKNIVKLSMMDYRFP